MARNDPGYISDPRLLPSVYCSFPVKNLGQGQQLVCSSPHAKRSPKGPRCANHWPKVCR